ncbi:unnamed protein product [Adineta steineri]|uniref:phosphorylase kinase n=1 Tax=Adineta steineri TaxID=433720 RepID=A0A813XYW1_9BILA|nr:unnamed protein product [Adineta steineri]CAF3847025.1 unnamed protein product [Adineta steineri]
MALDINDELPNREDAEQFYQEYDPIEVIGRGSSSIVWKCVEKLTGKEYACKIIKFNDSNECAAILCEIQILKLVGKHPNIIDIVASFETPNYVFIVMELCPNGDLSDYLTEDKCLSEKRTRQIMSSILNAVNHLHSHDIVHRDLKLENVLMDSKMNVKIIDFGFAVQILENKPLFNVLGTLSYMAPELLRCSQDGMPGYGLPVDLWACGVILYRLLVGFLPFRNRKQHLIFRMIKEGQYIMTGSEWSNVSETEKDLIRHLLDIDPSKRYTAAQALQHPFFNNERTRRKDFMAKRTLKAHIILIWSIHRLRTLHYRPQYIQGKELLENPYRFKSYREKDEDQNRAILFQTEEKSDLAHHESELFDLQRQNEADEGYTLR